MKICSIARVLRTLLAVGLASMLAGCSIGVSKVPTISDEMIKAHKGDVDGLWNSWIETENINRQGDRGIFFEGGQGALVAKKVYKDMTKTVEVISDGFEKFCGASGGTLRTAYCTPEYNFQKDCLYCYSSEGMIGEMVMVQKHNLLYISMDSPRRQREKEAAAKKEITDAYKRLSEGLATNSIGRLELSSLLQKLSNEEDPEKLRPKAIAKLEELVAQDSAHYESMIANVRKVEADKQRRIKESLTATGECPPLRPDQREKMGRYIESAESLCRANRGRVVQGDLQFQCNLPHGTSYAIFFRRNESCSPYAVNNSSVLGEEITKGLAGYFD